MALAARNSIAHVTDSTVFDVVPTNDMWLMRLIDYCAAQDYAVDGYALPRVVTELNVQLQNLAVQYQFDHVASRIALRCRSLI